ncbi:MAG: trypsin-like peptidase domain-containing protein [Candidatus Methylomirabilia bacterium]
MRYRYQSRWQHSLVILFWCLLLPIEAGAQIDENLVIRLKKTVVNVETSVSNALNAESVGRFLGTGFIVDAKSGIIATNRHVATTSPSQVKITFDNGESTEARPLHYDIYHDFAFYQVDVSKLNFPLQEVRLGSSFKLEEQDEVFLIGNNDGEEHSIKFGRVTNLIVDKGDRHSATFQTSFDRTGGSSGSPVFNAEGRVVGIHFAGTDTTSFELRIEYITDALKQLKSQGRVLRGDIGVELDLMLISDARKHLHLPEEVAERIQSLRKDIKRLIYIDRIVPRSPSEGVLLPGDLVVEVEGRVVGDDLYLLDKVIDANVGKEVSLMVYRNGAKSSYTVHVLDAEKTKIREFALFAGGVLHDLTPELRRQYEIESDGVFLSQAKVGTSFSELGMGTVEQETSYAVVVEEVNGIPTPNLESFIEAVRPLKNQDHIYVLVRNFRIYRQSTSAKRITLELKYDPLKIFTFSRDTLEWIEAGTRPLATATTR